MKKWEVLSSEDIYSDNWVSFKNNSYRNGKGVVIDNYTIIKLKDYSVVFPVTKDNKVVMVRQYKSGVDEIATELPMGFIEEGETPEQCAARELLEETGFTSDQLEHLGTYHNSPGKVLQRFHVFLAKNCAKSSEQKLDKTEDLEVEVIDIEKIRELAASNKFKGACTALGVALALKKLGV